MPLSRPLDESVVVITGASGGIGAATALALAARGTRLVLAARREPALAEIAARCATAGGRALTVPTDVTDPTAVAALADGAVSEFGRIDGWVNNASVAVYGPLHELPLDEVRRVIEVNVLGYVYGAQAAVTHMRRDGGVLVNVASVLGKVTTPYMAPYTMAKHAVRAMSASLRQDLRAEGVRGISVSTVLPASIDTPFYRNAANHTGRVVGPLPPVYQPSVVARVIVRSLEHPRREAFAGSIGHVLAAQWGLAPGLTERLLAWYGRTALKDGAAQDGAGTLFEPSNRPASVSGGWGGRGGLVSGLGLVAGAGAGLVAAAVTVNRLTRRRTG